MNGLETASGFSFTGVRAGLLDGWQRANRGFRNYEVMRTCLVWNKRVVFLEEHNAYA